VKTLGFIGVGELALYTIKGLRRGGYDGAILLSPRNRDKAALLQRKFDCQVQEDNQAVVANSDFVVISTRPEDCLETLAALRFRPGQVLISVVAGVDIARLEGVLNENLKIVRAMPVSSAEAAASPTLIYPEHAYVRDLFAYCGNAICVDREDYFNQGSILACVYSWFFALFEALTQATQGPRLPADVAAELVMGMAKGAAELALASRDRSPGQIAESIATEGTFSRLGLELLESEDAFGPWRKACKLLEKRLADNE